MFLCHFTSKNIVAPKIMMNGNIPIEGKKTFVIMWNRSTKRKAILRVLGYRRKKEINTSYSIPDQLAV